jgi:hypothetical protein
MPEYSLKTTISSPAGLIIKGLPFEIGDEVEVTIKSCVKLKDKKEPYPLKGKPFRYTAPFEPVAESCWEILK